MKLLECLPYTTLRLKYFFWPFSLTSCDYVNCFVALLLVSNSLRNSVMLGLNTDLSTQDPRENKQRKDQPLFLIGCFRCHHSHCHDVKTSSKCEKCLPICYIPISTPPCLLQCLHIFPPPFLSKHQRGVKWCPDTDGLHKVQICTGLL